MGAVAELAASQHGALNRRQAAALGLTSRQIRSLIASSFLDEPTPGVLRVRASPPTWHQRMVIATLAGGGFHAGFRAAAFLHRLDGCRQAPPVEVVGARSCRRIRGIDVVQHWVDPLPPEDLVEVDGIPSTGLARTVVDACSVVDADRRLRLVDDFERRRASLNWLRLTAERLHRPASPAPAPCWPCSTVVRSAGGSPTAGSNGWSNAASPSPDFPRGGASTRCSTAADDWSAGSTSPAPTCSSASRHTAVSSTSDRGPRRSTSDGTTASVPPGGTCPTSAGTTPRTRPPWRR